MTQKLSLEEAARVLSAWVSVEVLTPHTFKKPEELARGDKTLVARFDGGLPWFGNGSDKRPNTRLYYHIVLGTINLEKANAMLAQAFSDNIAPPNAHPGFAAICTITVNEKGLLVEPDKSIALSSYAWGLPHTLKKELKKLCEWKKVEKDYLKELYKFLRKENEEGDPIPLTAENLSEAFDFMTEKLGLPKSITNPYTFGIRAYEPLWSETAPQSFIMNSFYLDDLESAKSSVKKGLAPNNLLRFLGATIPSKRINVLEGHEPLKEILSPKHMPSGRWPGPGRHPLTLLQQAAVNLTNMELENEGVLAINGPPGTGKTTLLRDIIANVIVKRAVALSKFDDPRDVFTDTGHSFKGDKSKIKLFQIDESLKGFEILIASSNNKAVENLSAELPGIKAIAEDARDLRYFKSVADELLGIETWGLVSAVLGNVSNRYTFIQKFWRDGDNGISAYLAEAAGIPQNYDVKDLNTGSILESRKPRVITENDAPKSHEDALKKWHVARDHFLSVLSKSASVLSDLQQLDTLLDETKSLKKSLAFDGEPDVKIVEHMQSKPTLLKKIIHPKSSHLWQKQLNDLRAYADKQKSINILSDTVGPHRIDDEFFKKSHRDKHLTAPWCNADAHQLRDDVLVASMALHKAFIDVAAKPLLNNLGIFMRNLGKATSSFDKKHHELLVDLWASFFLVVPSVSTTFASVGRMLNDLPKNTFGWLLIDEAGQATPQAAVGAIKRAKRIVLTGDPIQIEPIVVLSEKIVKGIAEQFNVEAIRFMAPDASAQTLADEANTYYTEYHSRFGSRAVGVPLLVHRRCADPMFSISNKIAYENLMVNAKKDGQSAIRDVLGPSQWIDVSGASLEKWCPEEGQKVLHILSILQKNNIFPDIYIISPFANVGNSLRKLIKDSGIIETWLPQKQANSWIYERIGTVHTAQGREAEAVIFVLGAQGSDEFGSRQWAGATPNLLNVAVTRAKENLYVVGNRSLWKDVGVFQELHSKLG